MSDTDLVQALQQRDPAAFQQASDRYMPSLWRFVYVKVSGDQHLAEDIVSETMLALVQAVSDAETKIENIGGWLRGVASNKVNDYFRAAHRVRHLIDDAQKNNTGVRKPEDPVDVVETDEKRVEVRAVMDELSDQYRHALEWKYLDKLSVRVIADRWETTEKAVESILFRARREFRDRMEQRQKNSEIMCQTARAEHAANKAIIAKEPESAALNHDDDDEPPAHACMNGHRGVLQGENGDRSKGIQDARCQCGHQIAEVVSSIESDGSESVFSSADQSPKKSNRSTTDGSRSRRKSNRG